MRSITDYSDHREEVARVAWVLLIHLLSVADPQGRVERSMGQLARMVDIRGARVSRLLDELSELGILSWSRDADDAVAIALA